MIASIPPDISNVESGRAENVRITHVAKLTFCRFVSGSRELAARNGAGSSCRRRGPEWNMVAADAKAELLRKKSKRPPPPGNVGLRSGIPRATRNTSVLSATAAATVTIGRSTATLFFVGDVGRRSAGEGRQSERHQARTLSPACSSSNLSPTTSRYGRGTARVQPAERV